MVGEIMKKLKMQINLYIKNIIKEYISLCLFVSNKKKKNDGSIQRFCSNLNFLIITYNTVLKLLLFNLNLFIIK